MDLLYSCCGSTGMQPGDSTPGDPLRGVSVRHLGSSLIPKVLSVGLSKFAKIYEIEPVVIRPEGSDMVCPRDGRLGAAYVDCICSSDSNIAGFMLSYTWGYEVADIVATLDKFCATKKLNTGHTFVWMCVLCINQHRVQEARHQGLRVPFEQFEHEFGSRVRSIGKVIAMMAPWQNPAYLSRVWCIYEMFLATEQDLEVDIAMPPAEAEALDAALQADNLQALWATLTAIRVENAKSSVPEDQSRILDMIKNSCGAHHLNVVVSQRLQRWVVESAHVQLEAHKRNGDVDSQVALCSTLSSLQRQLGNYQMALTYGEQGLRLLEGTNAVDTQSGVSLLRNIAVTKRQIGDVVGALADFDAAKGILERIGTLETGQGATLLKNIGAAKGAIGDFDGRLLAFESARGIRERTNTLETNEGADLLTYLGFAKYEARDAAGALIDLDIAMGIRERTKTFETPGGADLMKVIGDMKGVNGDFVGQQAAYDVAMGIRKRTGTLDTTAGARLLKAIAEIQSGLKLLVDL